MDAANHALARYLARSSEVHLVSHRASRDVAGEPHVRIHRVWRPFAWDSLGRALLAREGRRVWRALTPRGVHAIVNGGNCRVGAASWVHYVHAAFVPVAAGSIVRRLKGSLLRRLDLADERRVLRVAPLVICNSRRTRDDVISRLGVEPSRAHVVYYGSDADFVPADDAERASAKRALGFSPDRPLVGFVGALGDRRKAFDTVFRAWIALCERPEWDADLLVVGAGAELPAWRRRTREQGLERRVQFLGRRLDMPTVFGALDALVHPARYEAYGLAVRESLCRGVPALVSASAGVAEHYPPDLAELLIQDPDNPDELVQRLRAWRCDQARFRRLVEPLSAALRGRSWDAMAAEIATLVQGAGTPR
jgi:glycosyltransferase involved in cell wall biosynthesis